MFMFGNEEKMKINIAKPCIQSTFCEASLREYFNNTDKSALFLSLLVTCVNPLYRCWITPLTL